jgi:catechol 2,3-dioxygenase-like lactoylglutathione lyase family enzyme
MLGSQGLIAFLATKNGATARTFYEKVLGFPVLSDDDYALAVSVAGVMLRVQKVEDFQPQPFTALGWNVADIDATVADLRGKGVHFVHYPGMGQDAAGVWLAPSGAKIAWFKDPDGNTLSLTQFA